MTSFLSFTSAGAALNSAGRSVIGSTVIGPPRHPAANFSVGPGGVSFLPGLPSTPAGSENIDRIPSKSNVFLEKNPRIALAYSVQALGDKPITQGDLVALKKSSDSWSFPRLQTVQEWMADIIDECEGQSDSVFVEAVQENGLVGVFTTAMDSRVDKKQSYGVDTVTINAARFCTIRDYWLCRCRAGDNLFIVATKHGTAPARGSTPKRVKDESVRFYFVCGPMTHEEASTKIVNHEGEEGITITRGDPSMVIRVGKAQNHIMPAHGNSEMGFTKYDGGTHGELFTSFNTRANRGTSRVREIHVDHLMRPHYFQVA